MYDDLLKDVEAIFGGEVWLANNIPTFPANYQGNKNGIDEYLTVSVLPSSSSYYAYDAKKQLEGLIAIKLFVPAGEGQGRLMAIANFLDVVLDSKVLTTGTKLGTSYLNVEGLDSSNKSLFSGSYFIPFTLYGE